MEGAHTQRRARVQRSPNPRIAHFSSASANWRSCGQSIHSKDKTAKPFVLASSSSSHRPADSAASGTSAKKAKTGTEMVQALKDLKDLVNAGAIDDEEYQMLKKKILAEE